MSVSATRKVSDSPSSAVNIVKKAAKAEGRSGSFVEAIDASNNISVRERNAEDAERRKQNLEQQAEEQERKEIVTTSSYVKSAIEVLAASGIYEETTTVVTEKHKSIGVYSNNQSMVAGEEKKTEPIKEEEKTLAEYLDEIYKS